MKENTFEELAFDESFRMSFGTEKIDMVKVSDVVTLMQQVREATKAEAVNINNEVVLFNMGVDLESDVDFRDANDEILSIPTDRIKLTENK